MKRDRSVNTATDSAQPTQGIALPEEKASKLPDEAVNLSPRRLAEGASVTTALLDEILAQQTEFHEVRYWGLNE